VRGGLSQWKSCEGTAMRLRSSALILLARTWITFVFALELAFDHEESAGS